MIFVSVGTFRNGFDALVETADAVCRDFGFEAFAQIGHSRMAPRHMDWVRFMSIEEMGRRLAAADLVICHGGIGIVGDAMRAERPIIVVPRTGRTGPVHPANDQSTLVSRLAERHPIRACSDLGALAGIVTETREHLRPPVHYDLRCNVPDLVRRYLQTSP